MATLFFVDCSRFFQNKCTFFCYLHQFKQFTRSNSEAVKRVRLKF